MLIACTIFVTINSAQTTQITTSPPAPTLKFLDADYGEKILIDTNTGVTIKKYHDALDFTKGLTKVQLGYEWIYIDKSGKKVTP